MAVGQKFMRFTYPDSSFTVPINVALTRGKRWLRVSTGARFKPKKLKSGKWAILAITPESHRLLYHLDETGMLYIRDGHGNIAKQSIGFNPLAVVASHANPNPDALAAVAASIDHHGTWNGDNDFAAKEVSIRGSGDVKRLRGRKARGLARKAKSTRRSPSYYNPVTGADGDFGDLADFADLGFDGGIDAGAFGDLTAGDLADFGDFGDCSAEIANAVNTGAPFNKLVGRPQLRCAGLAALVIGAAIGTAGGIVGSVLACMGSRGRDPANCNGNIMRTIGTTSGLGAAWAAYILADCPRETFEC